MDASKQKQAFSVNDVLIDPIGCKLKRKGQSGFEDIPLRSLQILQYLVQRDGELVTYKELEDHIWKGPASEGALYQQIAHLRKALADNPNNPAIIRTVPKLGYQFIGKVSYIEENSLLSRLNKLRNNRPLASTFMVIGFSIMVVFALSLYTYYHSDKHTLLNLEKNLRYPEKFLFLEKSSPTDNTEFPGLLNAIELIIEYHLDQLPNQHITYIPRSADSIAYARIMDHFNQFGQPGYSFTPEIKEKDNNLEISIRINEAVSAKAKDKLLITVPKEAAATSLSTLEVELLNKLRPLKLVAENQNTIFSNNADSNEALINSAEVLAQKDPELKDIEDAIRLSLKTIELTPRNIIAYVLLWEHIYIKMTLYPGSYSVERIIDLIRSSTEKALQHNPGYHKTLLADATIYCWLENLPECAKRIQSTFTSKPYNSRMLIALSWNLRRYNHTALTVDRFNYEINPFGMDVRRNFRNTLLNSNKQSEIHKVLEQHISWTTSNKEWIAESQIATRYDLLNAFANWYAQRYAGINTNSQPTLDKQALPSRYIAYMLLNAQQTDLARYWEQYGRERALPYLELKMITVLSDIWDGKQKLETWREIKALAEDRHPYQTAFDKINLFYLNYYTGLYNKAGDYLLELFPYFATESFHITQDNLRFAIYYSDILRKRWHLKRTRLINNAIRDYFSQLDNQQIKTYSLERAEFYALNGEREPALYALEVAVKKENWLPNAFMLQPPLRHNPFLENLKSEPKFIELDRYVSNKLSALCFSAQC